MKAHVAFTASTAFVASLGLHLTGFLALPDQKVQIKGGAQTQLARLGNSFSDMSEGTSSPVATQERIEPLQEADVANEPDTPEVLETPAKTTAEHAVTKEITTAMAQITPSLDTVLENSKNPVVPIIKPDIAPSTIPSVTPLVSPTVTPVAPYVTSAKPVEPLETIKAEAPVEVQKPNASTRRPVTRQLKPTVRKPVTKAAKPKPSKPRSTPPKPAKPAATQSTRRGQADGSKAGQATQSSQKGKRRTNAGNAATTNYRGKVVRKILRTRMERAGGRGRVGISFSISSSGTATSIRITRSSGNAKVDKIALRHIRRAAPFPRPPRGGAGKFKVVLNVKR